MGYKIRLLAVSSIPWIAQNLELSVKFNTYNVFDIFKTSKNNVDLV